MLSYLWYARLPPQDLSQDQSRGVLEQLIAQSAHIVNQDLASGPGIAARPQTLRLREEVWWVVFVWIGDRSEDMWNYRNYFYWFSISKCYRLSMNVTKSHWKKTVLNIYIKRIVKKMWDKCCWTPWPTVGILWDGIFLSYLGANGTADWKARVAGAATTKSTREETSWETLMVMKCTSDCI